MKHKIFWVTNFLVLTLFTVYSLVGVFGASNEKAYAQTLKDGDFYKKSKHFMVVDSKESKKGFGAGAQASLTGEQQVCSLSSQQVAELDAFFKVNTFDLTVDGNVVTIASIKGKHLSKRQLLDYLKASDQTLECKVVHHHKVFFLPVLPQLS